MEEREKTQSDDVSQKYEELKQEALEEAEQVLHGDPLEEAVDKKKD